MLEAITFGDDPKLAPGDRLRALEPLREFERVDAQVDGLSEGEILAELDSFFAAMLGAMYVASGPDNELDPKPTRGRRRCWARS